MILVRDHYIRTWNFPDINAVATLGPSEPFRYRQHAERTMKVGLSPLVRAAACIVVALAAHAVGAAEIRVLSTPTLKTALSDLRAEFDRSSGHRLVMQFDSVAALKRRIEGGEKFDVTVLLPSAIDDLVLQNKVVRQSVSIVARASVGVAVRADDPHPSIGTVDDLKKLLADSGAYAYAADSASGKYFLKMLERLELPNAQAKLKAVPGGAVIDAIARGDADLTVITVPNIVGVPGVRLAGLLPEALQNHTTFSAAIAASLPDDEPARAFLEFLRSEAAGQALVRRGFERVAP
ncbi:MAG: substrate-binding domain-containing protein [Caldimonas sp.]